MSYEVGACLGIFSRFNKYILKSERGGPGQLDSFQELGLPLRDLVGVDIEALGQLHQRLV